MATHLPRVMVPRGLIAGVTPAAVVIPQAMAYATIAGLPPEGAEPPKTRRSSFRTLPEGVTAPISESTL